MIRYRQVPHHPTPSLSKLGGTKSPPKPAVHVSDTRQQPTIIGSYGRRAPASSSVREESDKNKVWRPAASRPATWHEEHGGRRWSDLDSFPTGLVFPQRSKAGDNGVSPFRGPDKLWKASETKLVARATLPCHELWLDRVPRQQSLLKLRFLRKERDLIKQWKQG